MKLLPGGSEEQQEGDRTARGQKAGHQKEGTPVGHALVGEINLDESIKHGPQIVTDSQRDQSQQALGAGPDVGFGHVVDIDLRSNEKESETDPVKS